MYVFGVAKIVLREWGAAYPSDGWRALQVGAHKILLLILYLCISMCSCLFLRALSSVRMRICSLRISHLVLPILCLSVSNWSCLFVKVLTFYAWQIVQRDFIYSISCWPSLPLRLKLVLSIFEGVNIFTHDDLFSETTPFMAYPSLSVSPLVVMSFFGWLLTFPCLTISSVILLH